MAVFDYFVYASYRFSINKLGRNHDEALFSAVCMLAVYITVFIVGVISLLGILVDNPISESLVRMKHVFVMPLLIIISFTFEYYYLKVANDINVKIANREKHKSGKNMRRLIRFLLFFVPVFSFVAFRVYYTQ